GTPGKAGAKGARRGSETFARRQQTDNSDAAWRGEESQRVPARRRAVGRGQRADERQERGGSVRRIARTQEQVLMRRLPPPADIIARLALKPHPEGGHYRETFRDTHLDANGRASSTAIF